MQNAEDQPVIGELTRGLDLLEQVLIEGTDVSADFTSYLLFDCPEFYLEVGLVEAACLTAKV